MNSGQIISRNSRRTLRHIEHEANLEFRRLRSAQRTFILLLALSIIILGVDFSAALILFDYLDPTLGGVSLGPAALALTVPIAVVGIHVLVADQKTSSDNKIRLWLRRLAAAGVFIYLFGIASMVSLALFDATEGMGSGSQGPLTGGTFGSPTLGNDQSSDAALALFGGIFASVSPIVFFIGMTLVFFVSVFVVDRLLARMKVHYAFFSHASGRATKVKAKCAGAHEIVDAIDRLDARENRLRKKHPVDLDDSFSRIASSHIAAALHDMRRPLNAIDHEDAIMGTVLARDGQVPPHITGKRQGLNKIREIQHETSPYGVLKHLGCVPPKEEK